MRAYKLAEELGLTREDLIKKAAEVGIEIRNPMASLDEDQANVILRKLSAAADVETVQKRVGSGVIRRRKRKTETGGEDAVGAELEQESGAGEEPLAAETAPLAAESAAVRAPVSESGAAAQEDATVLPAAAAAEPPVVQTSGRGFAAATTPVRVVDDPLLAQPQPAAASGATSDAAPARRGPVPVPRDVEPEPEAAPFAGGAGRKAPRPTRPARADLSLREQETIARMMRGGNVQAQLERRRMLVEQQSRAQPQRKRAAPGRKMLPAAPGKTKRLVRIGTRIAVVDFSSQTGAKVRDIQRRAR
ncbi:MAG: translation initiation factor IF-2 N-terminal domain-containing protein, partial [bacterium]